MDDEALHAIRERDAEIRRLTARLDQLKSSFGYRLMAPIRFLERRLSRIARRLPRPGRERLAARFFPDYGPRVGLTGQPAAPPDPEDRSYGAWIARYDTPEASEAEPIRRDIAALAWRPLISIMLLPGPGDADATATLRSIAVQVHRDFEILAGPAPRLPLSSRLALGLWGIALRRPRRTRGAGIVNALLAGARGDYLLALEAGDRLSPLGTYHIARAASAGPPPDIVYGDEDEIGPDGQRRNPFFKPDWNAELALSFDYAGAPTAIRVAALRQLGGADPAAGPAWRWDAVLKLAERQAGEKGAGEKGAGEEGPGGPACLPGIRHVPFVLVHRRPAADAPAPDGPAADEAAHRIVAAALARRGEAASIAPAGPGRVSVRRLLPDPPPHVTIVVATRDRADLLGRCIAGILDRTLYPSLDLVIIDNGSTEPETLAALEAIGRDRRVTVIRDDRAFNFAALHNRAVPKVRGEIVVLLNNDIEIIAASWLEALAAQAIRPGVGAVGAKLLYPDETIQHAGMVLGLHGTAGHILAHRRRDDPGPHGLLAVAQEMSAVTGACLALRTSVFREVGGMNPRFAADFNDVDLCLRIRRRGYRVIWEPGAELTHLESATRGKDHASGGLADDHPGRRRFREESALFLESWADLVAADPGYSPNLSRSMTDRSLAFPPLVARPYLSPSPAAPAGGPGTRRRGRDGRLVPGVAIVGQFTAETGVGQAGRSGALALATTDISCSRHRLAAPDLFEEAVPFECARDPWSPYDTALYYLNADTMLHHAGTLPLADVEGRRRIGFWHWELPVFPAAWAPAIRLVDEIWTASRFTAQAVAAATDKPVRVIPHPVAARRFGRAASRARFGLPADAFVFLSVFDTNSYLARKNPEAVIAAFADAFAGAGRSAPLLVLKCHGRTGRGPAYEALMRAIAAHGRIVLIDRVLSEDEMAMLRAACDACVSLHRSEGYGLNLAEAMAEGRLAIGTGFSGNLEFMSERNSILVPYRMRAVGPGEYLCGQGQWWAEPEHDAAVAALRLAASWPEEVAGLARRAADEMAAHYSFERIGRRLVSALEGELPPIERAG